jgi:hypothetical protein
VILPKIKVGTRAWHEQRLQGIGASEISALFPIERPGYAMSAYTLRLVKRREIAAESVFAGEPDLALMGIELEPVVAKIIAAKHGFKIQRGGYAVDADEPRMRCSVDYIIPEPNDWIRKQLGRKVDGPGVFQIKTVILPQFHRHWTPLVAPDYVRLQVRQECAVLRTEWGMIGAGIGGLEYRAYPINGVKNGGGDDIREMIRRFWSKCIEGDHVPPIDASESTRLAIRAELPPRMFQPGIHDREGDEELNEAALQFDIAGENRRRAQQDYDRAYNQLTKLMGPALSAYSNDWFVDQSVSESRRTLRVKRRTSNAEDVS